MNPTWILFNTRDAWTRWWARDDIKVARPRKPPARFPVYAYVSQSMIPVLLYRDELESMTATITKIL